MPIKVKLSLKAQNILLQVGSTYPFSNSIRIMRSSFSYIFLSFSQIQLWQLMNLEFKLILKEDKFEIREYASKIIAQVEGISVILIKHRQKALKILADYIFGNNISKDGNSRIEMTAPVEMEPLASKN